MGSRVGLTQPNGFHPNGLMPDEAFSVIRPINPERWARAEDKAAELISRIQPNWSSEKHRNAVASFVQRLIMNCLPCKVFTFGSVPLKTYLPDGDIDLTIFSEDQNLKDKLANEVRDLLEREGKNDQAEFQVQEVHYIQAEVKIIKCLVDNIVVDISFNQLGGLCTLCFLEEVDNLINQNHLFKRSIILIKAWCYYESRILGAHHGLISTYALETLVLYIFHVYNNCFTGPLEVLYRFLEFFSKFDWANFCVSLWGPVPVSSLPSMAAESPRKDGGKLLLNKMFLSACSTAYSVFPGGKENQEQRFIAKHFNVVDPLRISNNLGRSVSKGNFYRIRSAFSLGAQQLARILKCQEESIVAEVNQFFVNTWDRHGKGCRPDAPIVDAILLRKVDARHSGKVRIPTSSKNSTGNFVSHVPEIVQSHSSLHSALQLGNTSVNPIGRIADAHKDLHAYKPKNYKDSTCQEASALARHNTQKNNVTKKLQNGEEIFRMSILQNRARSMHQFARTSSSPELTNMSTGAVSPCRRNVGTEKHVEDTSLTSNYTRRTRGPGTMENHVAKCSNESFASCSRPISSSGDVPSQSQEEVQDFMNLCSYSGSQTYVGHIRMPVNLASHPVVPFPPSILRYNPPNFAGTIPANLTSLESDWGTVVHYTDGHFSAPFPQHFNAMGTTPDCAEMIGRMNDSAVLAEADHQDDDCGFWSECYADSIRDVDPESEEFSTASSRLSPSSPATSSRTKASSESSWDGKPSKMTNTVRYQFGNKKHGTWNPVATANSRWQVDRVLVNQTCVDADDNCNDRVPLSNAESLPPSVTSPHAEVHQLSGFGPPHMNYPNSVFPFAPLIVRPGSQQGMTHSHAVLPVKFYPAGPPMPFVTMVPIHDLPTEVGTSGAPTCQHDMETEKSGVPLIHSAHSSESAKDPKQMSNKTENYNSKEWIASGEHSGDGGSDIFQGDFTSHWKNLQYGRLCQNSQFQHPFVYPPPLIVTPQHLQGQLPFDAPGKPLNGRANALAHVVPVSAPQPGSSKPDNTSRRYGAEVSKNRNGIGTYFPNPKIIRDRQFNSSRQYRGDFNYDRNEHHGDREANSNLNSKPRSGGRAQARCHYEKRSTKMDRSAASASQSDKPRNMFQHNSNHLYRYPNGPSTSKPAHGGPDIVNYSEYPMRSAHRNEVFSSEDSLPLLMLYPCTQIITYGSQTEQLQFGSVGPDHFVGLVDVPELCGFSERGHPDMQNSNEGISGPPSPDFAFSPRFLGGGGF